MVYVAVAETVCCKSHTVEEHTLVAKLANMTQGTDPKRDLEHLNEEWTKVECSVGPHLRDEEFYRQYFETVESGGLVEDIIINTEDRKVLVTFHSGKGISILFTYFYYPESVIFILQAPISYKATLWPYFVFIYSFKEISTYKHVPMNIRTPLYRK